MDPNDVESYANRGNTYNRKGLYDRAIEDLNKATAIDPNNAEVYITRGVAYANKGVMGRAISDFQKACDMGDGMGCEYLQRALRKR